MPCQGFDRLAEVSAVHTQVGRSHGERSVLRSRSFIELRKAFSSKHVSELLFLRRSRYRLALLQVQGTDDVFRVSWVRLISEDAGVLVELQHAVENTHSCAISIWPSTRYSNFSLRTFSVLSGVVAQGDEIVSVHHKPQVAILLVEQRRPSNTLLDVVLLQNISIRLLPY